MGKNIHEQIISGQIDVSHEGEERNFDMPDWMRELSEVLQDKEKFIQKLEEHNLTLAFLHSGLTATIIELRAHIRPKKGEKLSTVGEDAGLDYKPSVKGVPKTKKSSKAGMDILIKLAQLGEDLNKLAADPEAFKAACKKHRIE